MPRLRLAKRIPQQLLLEALTPQALPEAANLRALD